MEQDPQPEACLVHAWIREIYPLLWQGKGYARLRLGGLAVVLCGVSPLVSENRGY